jgi:WD40 repeat protein
LATASLDGTIRVWSIEGPAPLWTSPGAVASPANAQYLAWSPESQRLAVGDATRLLILDATTGAPLATYAYVVSALAWSPDGRSIAIGDGYEGQVRVLRVADGCSLVIYRRHMLSRSWLLPNKDPRMIRAIAWSPDGKYLVSGGDGRTLCVWRARLFPGFLPS